MPTLIAALAVVVAATAWATDLQVPAIGHLETIASPFAQGSGEPCLAVSPTGVVYMTAFEPRGEHGAALLISRLDGERWTKPTVVADSMDFFVNWADFPRLLALSPRDLVVHVPARSGADPYAYDVLLTRSRDGGVTWSTPMKPHRDGTKTEHGFVSLLPESSAARVVWLDGRNAAGHQGHGDGPGPDMTLRTAVVAADGSMRDETLLDDRVCDCCQTAATVIPGGMLVAYRDRSADEVRDIALVRREDGDWSIPYALRADGWKTPACPVNGPALASRDERVAVAWYTEGSGRPQVKVAFSRDAGRTFGTPVRADWGDPLGRVGVHLLEDGTALLWWMEMRGPDAEFMVRRVRSDGNTGLPITVARTAASRSSGFPQLVVTGERVVMAWTDGAKTGRVRTAFALLPQ